MLFLSREAIEFILLLGLVFLVALLPTRRLFLAGWRPRALLGYLIALIAIGLLIVELRAAARFLIPIVVLAYIAPFVAAPVLQRFVRSGGNRRLPPRNVTPRDPRSGDGPL